MNIVDIKTVPWIVGVVILSVQSLFKCSFMLLGFGLWHFLKFVILNKNCNL